MEIEFLDSTRWIKCQWKYPSHGLYKQQNSSGQVYYLVLFLSSVARHFLILYYQNTDICPSGMCWLFSLIWSVLASSSTNPSKATLTLFIFCLSRVWKAVSVLLLITHNRGAPKNTGECSNSAQMSGYTPQPPLLILSCMPALMWLYRGRGCFAMYMQRLFISLFAC